MNIKNIVLLMFFSATSLFASASMVMPKTRTGILKFNYTIENKTTVPVQAIQNYSGFCVIDVCAVASGKSTTISRPCPMTQISFGIGMSLLEKIEIPDASGCLAKDPAQQTKKCDTKSRCWQTDAPLAVQSSTWVIEEFVGEFKSPSEEEDKNNGIMRRIVLPQTENNMVYTITQKGS